jgi:ADP-heptose:LPS heptosyltransferase
MGMELRKICVILNVVRVNILTSSWRVPIAFWLSFRILKRKDTHYVIVCNHIGDFIITVGYLKEFKKQHNIHHLTLCSTQKLIDLARQYNDTIDDTVTLEKRILEKLLYMGSTKFGRHIVNEMGQVTLVNSADAFLDDFFKYPSRFPQLTLKDCICYGDLNLNAESIFVPLNVTGENMSGKARTVILCPYAVVTDKISILYFENIADYFLKKGYQVYTNHSSEDGDVIKGTESLDGSLKEIFEIADRGAYIIGIRSGLLDLLSYARCKIISIYPRGNPYQNFFDLHMLPCSRADVMQINEEELDQTDLKALLSFLQKE